MKQALDQFQENIERARILSGLAQSLSTLTTGAVDCSDILRASLVLGVSALDHFVHEFVRLGMLEVHQGNRPVTDSYLTFKVPMAAARVASVNTNSVNWLDQAIRENHAWLSFQHPDKIADAIRLMSMAKLWDKVATELGTIPKDVKVQLSSIVDRRNKIAHEADLNPTNPGYRWPIDGALVADALNFIEALVGAIYKVCYKV